MKSILMAALIAALVVTSGLVDINIEHHLNLPEPFKSSNIIETHRNLSVYYPWVTKESHIYMKDELEAQKQVTDMIKVLNEAKKGDLVVFHLAGYGGNVEVFTRLINSVQSSKAHVTMVVEAPVYSGHAYLAVSGNELIMKPYSYLMLHTSSGYGYDCTKETGEDRTVPNSEHCQVFLNNHINLINYIIDNIRILTVDEKNALKSGHDIYITSGDYQRRMILLSSPRQSL